jgi:excisionase family DNA binding protein
MSEIMNAEEAAKYLKMSAKTVIAAAKRGEIPGLKIGSIWRFRKDQLDAMFGTNVKGNPNDQRKRVFPEQS